MSRILETPLGSIETEIVGTGCPVLVLHGSPGGVDAARAMSKFLPADQFKCILVSRPGYLGTPLSTANHSIDDEADLLPAVLDTLGILRIGILAWSGGGPSAYRFAVRHPERIFGLVTIAAVSRRWSQPKPNIIQSLLFGTNMGSRLVGYLAKHRSKQVVGGALEGEGSIRGEELILQIKQTMADPEQRQLVLDIAQTVNTGGQRKKGWENDVANFREIASLELERIKCPVLLIHGDSDTDADIEHSRFAHSQIQSSELVEMNEGTHLSFYAHTDAKEAQAHTRAWLLQHATASEES